MRRFLVVGRDVLSAQDYVHALREQSRVYATERECPQYSLPRESSSPGRIRNSRRECRIYETHHVDRGHPRRGYLPRGTFVPR